jgi:Tfp pilus assembly protein PilF
VSRVCILLVAVTALFCPALKAQPASDSLEKDARNASRAGNFREAAVKFEQAATAASDARRRGRLRMQAAYATLNGGNAKAAREILLAAFADDPALEIVEQLYTPEFRALWTDARAEAARAIPPALPDLEELKRASEEKLGDGRFAEVVYDLGKYPQDKLDRGAWALLAEAYEKAGRSDQAALARRRSLGETVAITPLPAIAPPAAGLPGAKATPADLLTFGREALARGDAPAAQAAANRVVEVEPASSEGYRLLGDSYSARGEKALADAMWRQSLRLNERNEATLLSLAGLSLEATEFDARSPS